MMQTGSIIGERNLSTIGLLRIFYQHKLFISLCTLLGFVIGLAIISLSHPIYEAKIKLIPATEGEIAGFNQGRSGSLSSLPPITLAYVNHVFNNQLLSQAVKESFFKQFYLPAATAQKEHRSAEQLYADLSHDLTITADPLTAADRFAKYNVAIRGNDANQVAAWLTQFVTVVKMQVVNLLLDDMQQQNRVLTDNLRHQIQSVRNKAKAKRLDRITQLKEKLRTVQLAQANMPFWDDDLLVMNDATEPSPLARVEMMSAEIKNLAARRSDDAYIPELRELQAKLEYATSFKVDPEKVAVFHVDGVIATPSIPIAPKKRLILMEALVVGLMTGILGVMVQIAWRRENQCTVK